MARPSSYPQLTPGTPFLTYADDGTADRHAEMPGYVSNPPATKAEVRAGSATDKVVTPSTLRSALAVHEAASQRQWSPWGALTVGFFTTYGTPLGTLLSYRDDNGGQYSDDNEWSPTVNPLTTAGTYGDIVAIYNGGFVDTITQPPAPSVGDRWELAAMFRARTGSALIMLTRWRDAGLRLYRSSSFDTPVWEDMPASSDEILHNPLAATAGTGWHVTYGDPSQWPLSSHLNVLYHLNDGLWLTKLEGNTLTAFTVGYNASTPYVIAHASREYEGVSALVGSDPIFLVDSATDLPANPVTDTIILAGATFGTYTAGRLYRYDGSAYVLYPLDLSAMTGEITVANIDSGSAGNNTVPTADGSGGVVWRAQQGGSGGGSTHPYLVSGNTTAPDAWQVNDVVINIASNNVTIARGTDTNNILLPKTWNRVVSISTNEISFADLQFRGSLIVGQQTIGVNKLSPGSATDGQVAQVDTVSGTKQVVYADLPNNSVSYDQINDASKGANRIIHYNAAGTGITSSPHTDFDIDGTQITSGTIPAARVPTLPIGTKTSGNLPMSRVTGKLPTAQLPDTIPIGNLPSNLGSAINETSDLNDLWHTPGIYLYNPGADNAPDVQDGGVVVANHNAQVATETDGRVLQRQRNVAISGQGTPANLNNSSVFTRITDMSTNLNNIDSDSEYGFYTWSSANGNVAGTNRPVNSPSYAGTGVFANQDAVALAECRANYQIVKSGRSELNDPGHMQYRLRGTGAWGSWQEIDFIAPYTGGALAEWPDVMPVLQARGLNVASDLRQIHQPASGAGDVWLLVPPGNLANHPQILSTIFTSHSRAPIFVQWTWVTNVLQLRVYYCFGTNLLGVNTITTEGRTQSVSYTRTVTNWAVKNDSVTGGSYSSSNGTLTLTREYGTNLSITGLPYVTSS